MSTREARSPLVTALAAWSALGAVAAAALAAPADASGRDEGRSPNILMVLTDDQRSDAVGRGGRFPFLETPHLDRLAAEGISFQNAFVTTSLCSPSRASILTGSYAHRHGVLSNDREDLDPALPSFPALLQRAGYETAFVGKWHMAPSADPRPGYDYWLSFSGQGVYRDPLLNENGRALEARGYTTDLLTDYATRWLERDRDAPFALILSHKASHHPFTPAPRHRDAFADASLPRPGNAGDDLAGKPAWVRLLATRGYSVAPWEWRMASLPAAVPESEPWVGAWDLHTDYLRSLLAVDESLGVVLALLDARGELENTLVVFTSDNGYLLGEHQLTNKMLMYERSIRVPLVIRGPDLAPGGERDALVTNLDLAPTILEAAGLPVPESVQGRSLLPLARDADHPWRDALFYEYFRSPDLPSIPDHLGVRTARWKYIRSGEGESAFEELYDLLRDPEELTNLAPDPAHAEALGAMRRRLARERAAADFPERFPRVGPDESRWRWTAEYWRRELVVQARRAGRALVDWLHPLKVWLGGLFGGEDEARVAIAVSGRPG